MAFEPRKPWRVIALLALLAPRPLLAQTADAETRTLARELALQGAEAFERGDFEAARDRFERAESLFRAPSITVMAARSLVGLGRFLAALDKYEETARTALGADAPEPFVRAVSDARKEAAALRARLPYLKLRVASKPAHPEELRVHIDGKLLPSALLDVERPIDPGTHRIEADAPGSEPFARSVSFTEAQHVVLDLELKPLRARAVAGPETARGALALSERRMLAVGVGSAGALALIVSGVTGAIALNRKSELDSKCHPGCPASAADDISSFRTNRTLSYTTFALGVVALGGGAYLWLTGAPNRQHVVASVSARGIELGGAF